MKPIQKPIRLSVLAIFIVAAYGIMPFVSVFFVAKSEVFLIGFQNLPFNGSIYLLYDADGNSNIVMIFISVFLCVFTAASAIWAFYGDTAGRIAALIFLTLDVVWWVGIVIFAIAISSNGAGDKIVWGAQLIGPPIWLGIIWWNFTRPDVNAYYKYIAESNR